MLWYTLRGRRKDQRVFLWRMVNLPRQWGGVHLKAIGVKFKRVGRKNKDKSTKVKS